MGKNVKVWFDEETDILYVSLGEGISVDSEEVAENSSRALRIKKVSSVQKIGISSLRRLTNPAWSICA